MSEFITLRALLARIPEYDARGIDLDIPIQSFGIDSRKITPGALFVALHGEHVDGRQFIGDAVRNGAVAVVAESRIETPSIPTIVVTNSQRALSSIASIFYGDPSQQDMRVVGVTGTNGKTTTTHMLEGIFTQASLTAGVIGTIGGRLGQREWKLANTTPLAPELHMLLAQMRDGGARAVAMEVSSHALALDRVNDVRFAVGAFTNLTRDHLDFHETLEAYAAAKHRLFALSERCVFNLDDEHGARWAAEFVGTKPSMTYSAQGRKADLAPRDITLRGNGSTFSLEGTHFEVRIPGSFNVSNALCAIACARLLSIDDATIARGLATIERVPGRMERVYVPNSDVDVVVDYAHTPDSLENVLRGARAGVAQGSSLVVIFGCGGNRDRGKRPLMGHIASELADRMYITNDNPRAEDPQTIANEIVAGIEKPLTVELDRQCAIERAILEAQPADTIVIAGKGHEDYQIIGNTVFPFDDTVVARKALEKRTQGVR